MPIRMFRKIAYLAVISLLCVSLASGQNDYKITYVIEISEDGTAFWNVEYRTLLATRDDLNSFENYSKQLQSVYLKEFKDLMQKSTASAASATSRNMMISDLTGSSAVQSTPTGSYGIVRYSFGWTNFAKMDTNMVIGDAFVGGLYLSRDNTLIIKYPSGYSVEEVTPQPDLTRDGLLWYGLRSFGAGEPRIVLSRNQVLWIPALIIIFMILAAAVIFVYLRKTFRGGVDQKLSETDMMNLEERIVKLLKDSGGSLYQSEIGRKLDIPKSTVSSALNELYNKNIIQKIKKGRENLIRLT